jgi:hypothetical protein
MIGTPYSAIRSLSADENGHIEDAMYKPRHKAAQTGREEAASSTDTTGMKGSSPCGGSNSNEVDIPYQHRKVAEFDKNHDLDTPGNVSLGLSKP